MDFKIRLVNRALLGAFLLAFLPGTTLAQLSFQDPRGDDDGPGAYVYPTSAVYPPGSFDITSLTVTPEGGGVDLRVEVAARLVDSWRMGTGFSVQMFFLFVDVDGRAGSGFTSAPPGLNVAFAPTDAWDYCVILSPQDPSRVRSEVERKVPAAMRRAMVVPKKVEGRGNAVTARVWLSDLGGGDPAGWGYQLVAQANEGFPADDALLTRDVRKAPGEHHFGGGADSDCDPHVIDLLAGSGRGAATEAEAQHRMLRYECSADGTARRPAILRMVRSR